MRVFVTGATGFVGTAIVRELLDHGHQVLGLARSDASADKLAALGADAMLGDLEALETLAEGVRQADAAIHAGFMHDFARYSQACEIDRLAIETLGNAINDSAKPFIVTAGVAFISSSGPLTLETDAALPPSEHYPRASEKTAKELSDRGIPTTIMRLPPSVHGAGDHGFVPTLIEIARQTGRSAYIEDGANAWPAVHVEDAARAFRLAIEHGPAANTFHAVSEESIPFRRIAEVIGAGLGVPSVSLSTDEAQAHFGWFYPFASINQPTSSARTRDVLGWQPKAPDLLTDMANAGYFMQDK